MKKPVLDEKTLDVVKRVLALPPKHHDEMKVGRPAKRQAAKGRAASAKPRNASKTARES